MTGSCQLSSFHSHQGASAVPFQSAVFLFFPAFPSRSLSVRELGFSLSKDTNVQLGSREVCVNSSAVLAQIALWIYLPDMRGFMTAHGQPDQPRSARYVLKDYVNVSSAGIWVLFSTRTSMETFTVA